MENRNCLDESNRLNQGRPSGLPRSLKIGKENYVEKIFDKPPPPCMEDFLNVKPVAPWMSPVEGDALLDTLHDTIQTCVIADDCYVTAMVLWIVHLLLPPISLLTPVADQCS